MTKIKSLTKMIAAVPQDARMDLAHKIAVEFDARIQFEKDKNPHAISIEAKLNKMRARMAVPSAAAVLMAAQVDIGFINRSVNEGKRYNVYAVDKIADIIAGLDKGEMTNAVNQAVTRSLFAFRAAGESFTGEMAKAATSNKIKVTANLQKLLVSHTVSYKTADTQSSSTMSALKTLGIVKNTGSVKHPVWQLTESPQTQRLEETLKAA